MLNIKCIPGLNITLREVFAVALFVIVLGVYQFVLPLFILPETTEEKTFIDLGIKFALFVGIVILLYGRYLKESFGKLGSYKIFKLLGAAIGGVIFLHVLLHLVRMGINYFTVGSFFDPMSTVTPDIPTEPLPPEAEMPLGENLENFSVHITPIEIIGAFSPLFNAFVEEVVFRHALLYKFKNNRFALVCMVIVSSILFGLIHYYNFGADIIKTIPYMFVGLFFGLVYIFSKNIWYSCIIHLAFNACSTLFPVLLLLFLV